MNTTTMKDNPSVEEPEEEDLEFKKSPLDAFNKEMFEYLMSQNKNVVSPSDTDKDEERQREGKLKQIEYIEKKRVKSRSRFDQVEDMYAKAMERRMRAMEHIANDPPADRLIGRNMTSHVPAAQMKHRPLARTVVEDDTEKPTSSTRQDNVHLFLTELDDTEPTPRSGRRSPRPTRSAKTEEQNPTGGEWTEKAMDEHTQSWKQMGYNAVLVGDGKAGPRSTSNHRHYRPPPSKKTKPASQFDEYAWMKLAPLPPVCLVQKRLATDDKSSSDPPSRSNSNTSSRNPH